MAAAGDDDAMCPVLNRVEQQRNFGIDCGDEILFAAGAWAPGGEHTKKLHVKNVSNRTLKLKYDLPRTKYFSMEFPVLITLSPGTSRILDIAFRPVQYEEYDDFIRVLVHIIDGGVKATSGSFRLPVKARISMLNTDIPNGIDFGFCPTAETTEFKFPLKSTGQIDATFQWTLPDAGDHGRPFSIKPASGELRAGQTLEMTATFSPHTASVFVVTVHLVAQERQGETHQRQEKTMKISGIGKYAYFAASESELDFGDMLVGGGSTQKHPTDKEFVLRNRSLVRATFQVVPVENDHEPLFFFSPLRGVIPPEASVPITVKYTPLSPGTFTCDTFKIQTPGGHTVRVTCRGKAIGPLVSLWKKNLASNLIKANSINFKDVQVGAVSTRVLILKNESNVAVRYNFMAAPNGVFQIDKVAGIVPPLLETSVMLTFRPENPGNFYRRLFILVQNQSTIYVDILGTGYDKEIRPSPFQQAHVDAYRLRCQHHWGHLSPDGLETLLEDKGDAYFLHGALRAAKNEAAGDPPKLLTRSGESTLTDVGISDEFFHSGTSRSNAIVVSESLLEFGSHGAKKTLVVTNQTRGKVTCSWRISETNGEQAAVRSNFRISPASCDVGPGASADFVVTFDPCHANAYYFAELESHVFFKSNRTFRLVNSETFTPPWCVVVHASGHTFGSGDSQFLSKVTFLTAKDHVCPFPPAHVGDSVFQTVSLANASDTPALFSVVQDPSRVFWVHPPSGLIPPNGFHLVQIRFTPTHPRRYLYRLKTIVNYVSEVVVDLTGMGCRPQLTCVDSHTHAPIDTIYIKPTAVGLTTTRQFHVHNTSRVPLVFRWQLPPALHSTFQVLPLVHRLGGNERQLITCVFSPSQLKQYNQRIAVHVKSISMGLKDHHKASLGPTTAGFATGLIQETSVKLLGVGTTGAVSFVPSALTLPTVLVNSPTSMTFHVVNSSDCDLKYELSVVSRAASNSQPGGGGDDVTKYISFSSPRGVLGARSHQVLEITFRADLAGAFAYDIACAVSTLDMTYSVAADTSVTMAVAASASFPTLLVEDVRVQQTSTCTAWTQFQVPAMNAFLMAPLTKDELKLNAESSPDLTALPSFNVNFTPATVGAPPEVVYIQLRNPGSLVVTYRIYYPNESDVELEPWADRGEPTSDELRQNIIVDSKLFSITPRSGVLQPHQTLLLCLSYTYSSTQYGGVHDLPVMLNVAQGKKMTLVLNGRTLPPSTPHVFLPSDTATLHPVMVGQCMRKTHRFHRPSVQQIPIFNAGDRPVKIDIDDSAWSLLNAHQFNFPVLECLTPHLVVPAHATGYIDVDFCPIEDKTYTSELRLYATGIDTDSYEDVQTISVVARGYHSPATFGVVHAAALAGGPPATQLLHLPSTAALSHDRVDFGQVSVRTDNCRVVVLTNVSATATVSFAWDESHPLLATKRVRCMPSQGKLAPLQHVLVRVVVQPQDDLRVIDHDFACWVRVISDAATAPAPSSNQFSSPLSSSAGATTLNSSLDFASSKTDTGGGNATRPSVITRSTVSSRSHVNRGGDSTSSPTSTSDSLRNPDTKRLKKGGSSSSKKQKWRLPGALSNDDGPAASPAIPLFLHVFAHVVPLEFFRHHVEPATFRRHPLALPPQDLVLVDAIATQRATWGFLDPKAAKESRHVLEGVLGHLLVDVLNSGAVTEAMAELPEEPPTPAFVQFKSTTRRLKAARTLDRLRHHDDVKRLTATVLENTVFNLIQEIACGDFDLTCLPKQLVFHPSEPDDAAATAACDD